MSLQLNNKDNATSEISRAEKRKHRKKLHRKKRRVQIAIERQQHQQDPEVQRAKERAFKEWEEQVNQESLERIKWKEREKEYEKRSQILRQEMEAKASQYKEKQEKKKHKKEKLRNVTKMLHHKPPSKPKQLNQHNISPSSNISTANISISDHKTHCPFFARTGVCRYGLQCSYRHVHPSSGTIVVFPGMYGGAGTFRSWDVDPETVDLENDETEIQKQYEEFYFDVIAELIRYGELKVFQVARNHALHIRGNVYVQYSTEREAQQCIEAMNGRYYAQKQLFGYLNPIENWNMILCSGSDCKGIERCNLIHPFRNPKGNMLAPKLWSRKVASPSPSPSPSSKHLRSDQHKKYHKYHERRHNRSAVLQGKEKTNSARNQNRVHSSNDYASHRKRKRKRSHEPRRVSRRSAY